VSSTKLLEFLWLGCGKHYVVVLETEYHDVTNALKFEQFKKGMNAQTALLLLNVRSPTTKRRMMTREPMTRNPTERYKSGQSSAVAFHWAKNIFNVDIIHLIKYDMTIYKTSLHRLITSPPISQQPNQRSAHSLNEQIMSWYRVLPS